MEFDRTNPGFPALRVTLQEHDVGDLMAKFPKLTRTEITDTVVRCGPMRHAVESELVKLSAAKR
jgi:hypothetical protein